MRQNIERKGRNPRITVCYTPDDYKAGDSMWTEEKPVYP